MIEQESKNTNRETPNARAKSKTKAYSRVHYVYTLTDSRDSSVFYVGKGCGKRVYAHRADAVRGKEKPVPRRIREILADGGDVIESVIAKFGNSSDACAREREEIGKRTGLLNMNGGGSGIGPYDAKPSFANPDEHARFWGAIIACPVVRAKGGYRL